MNEQPKPGPWYVDDYQPGRLWIRRDMGDWIDTLCQDVDTKERADMVVRVLNSFDDLLDIVKRVHDNDPHYLFEEAIAKAEGRST